MVPQTTVYKISNDWTYTPDFQPLSDMHHGSMYSPAGCVSQQQTATIKPQKVKNLADIRIIWGLNALFLHDKG
jgi:hypothetical protein